MAMIAFVGLMALMVSQAAFLQLLAENARMTLENVIEYHRRYRPIFVVVGGMSLLKAIYDADLMSFGAFMLSVVFFMRYAELLASWMRVRPMFAPYD